jgi:phage-related protein
MHTCIDDHSMENFMALNDDRNTRIRFIVKEIVFCPGAEKELKSLPENHQISFWHDLNQVAHGMDPTLAIDHLESAGAGVIELKINGRPAFRCIYYNKLPGQVLVVHATPKTMNGSDPKILRLVKQRLKAFLSKN